MAVKITNGVFKASGARALLVESPYHPDLPARAKVLGGKWQAESRVWAFDARDEADVRALYSSIYGTDGSAGAVADVEIDLAVAKPQLSGSKSAFMFGREVARVWSRDGGAALGDGVRVLAGGFDSGGSRNNPCLNIKAYTRILMRDVPVSLLDPLPAGVTVREAEKPATRMTLIEPAEGQVPEAFTKAFAGEGDAQS